MARLTMTIGGLLTALGIVGYVMSGMLSVTALIPSAFGLMLIVLGALGQAEARRKLMMHLAMVVGLLGLLGSFSGLLDMPTMLSGGEVARPAASIARAAMAAILLVYLVAGVRSFAAARRR